jgi:acetylglutamate kinase
MENKNAPSDDHPSGRPDSPAADGHGTGWAGSPPADAVETSDAVLRFLESIGRRSEAEFYLALFRAESKESFANLVISASVLRDGVDAVVLDLRFLRGLGLVPVVSVGFGSSGQAGAELVERFHRRLDKADIPSRAYSTETPALAEAVTESARNGVIPIVAFTKGDPNDAVARFDALGDLSVALKTRKLIFVARRGGLRLRQGDGEMPIVNLATDYDTLVSKRLLSPTRLFLLEQSRRLLVERATHRMFIAITSPLSLLRELFTVRGAGTLIKRGSTILRKSGYAEVDTGRLETLLASSFGRELTPGFFERDMTEVYLEEGYRGAALLRHTDLGAYLCKFAVEREAQGEGIGRDIWQVVTGDHKTLFWRARPHNPIRAFYTHECDGMVRTEHWHVFWKGLPAERISDAVSTALAQPIDFQEA